jgi:hypothetical protein
MRAITAATRPCRAGSGYSPVPLDGLDRARPGGPDLAAARRHERRAAVFCRFAVPGEL